MSQDLTIKIACDNQLLRMYNNVSRRDLFKGIGAGTIKVRGIDKSGKIQESGHLFARTFPEGAKGLHSVSVKVT